MDRARPRIDVRAPTNGQGPCPRWPGTEARLGDVPAPRTRHPKLRGLRARGLPLPQRRPHRRTRDSGQLKGRATHLARQPRRVLGRDLGRRRPAAATSHYVPGRRRSACATYERPSTCTSSPILCAPCMARSRPSRCGGNMPAEVDHLRLGPGARLCIHALLLRQDRGSGIPGSRTVGAGGVPCSLSSRAQYRPWWSSRTASPWASSRMSDLIDRINWQTPNAW